MEWNGRKFQYKTIDCAAKYFLKRTVGKWSYKNVPLLLNGNEGRYPLIENNEFCSLIRP